MPELQDQFPIHDPLGIQPAYTLEVLDENDDPISASEFGGMSGVFQYLFPPQSIQIHRSIRSDVQKDISSGVSTVSGGEGIGRIVMQGTHGVGPQKDPLYPTIGKQARDLLVQFFQTFISANDERGRVGKPGLRMVFWMYGGSWSEPVAESYYVWPESFPVDSRSNGRPHAWDWSSSLILLAPWVIASPMDWSTIPDPLTLASDTSAMAGLLGKIEGSWKRAQATLQNIKDLRSNLLQISTRIKDFVDGAQDAIYEVTDLARGSAQISRTILATLSPSAFMDTASTALRGALYDTRRLLGQANLTATSFRVTGAVSASLTGSRTASLSRPVTVGVSSGDTLAAIAAKHLGDSAKWPQLVAVNNLEFPFLDFSGTGGRPGLAYESLRVLGATDVLKLPLPATASTVGVSDDPIGTDLPDVPTIANTLQGGAANLSAALIRRLITPKGRIPWHPGYGSRLKKKIGTGQTLATSADIKNEVVTTLRADHRVLDLRDVVTTVSVGSSSVKIASEVVSPLGVIPIRATLLNPTP
jgi:phage baseplate assembly protein W